MDKVASSLPKMHQPLSRLEGYRFEAPRIHALDGSFIIESAPTRGTTLLIILPIQNRAAEGSKPREGIQVS
jgi:hypothetical protein